MVFFCLCSLGSVPLKWKVLIHRIYCQHGNPELLDKTTVEVLLACMMNFPHPFDFARILCHANTSCFEYRGHRWDTWWPYLGHLGHLRVGASAIFGTPTHIHCTHKMWPECWTLLGTPPLPPPPPPWRLNLREEFGDNPLIDFRGISSCIMDMSYHSWSRPSLCDSGLHSALPEYWFVPLTPATSIFCPLLHGFNTWQIHLNRKRGKGLMKKTTPKYSCHTPSILCI